MASPSVHLVYSCNDLYHNTQHLRPSEHGSMLTALHVLCMPKLLAKCACVCVCVCVCARVWQSHCLYKKTTCTGCATLFKLLNHPLFTLYTQWNVCYFKNYAICIAEHSILSLMKQQHIIPYMAMWNYICMLLGSQTGQLVPLPLLQQYP